jgi:hypothetical protein
VELAAEDEDQQLAWKVVAEAERAMEARDGRRSIERAGGGRSGALGARKGEGQAWMVKEVNAPFISKNTALVLHIFFS